MVEPLGNWTYTWPFLAAFIAGYLLGSIPFGLLLTRLSGLGDIRRIGSGNIGATNVLRTGRKGLALATLLLDGSKGTVAVLLAGTLGQDMAVLAGAGAVLGHCFPVWLKFRGGKGMATFLGMLLGLAFWAGLAACATWLVVAALARYSSLATLAAALASPLYAYLLADWQRMEVTGALVLLLVLRHHANIRRLIRGEEPRIGGHRSTKQARDTTQD
jgi:acyl phosphate:glycerol-3-phosphate acyltransferase